MENSILNTYKSDLFKNKTMTEKQQKILKASIDLFSKNGYANTSTKEISKKAGVAEGTIFKHFETKENLLFSCIIPFIFEYVLPEITTDFKSLNLKEVYPDFRSFIHNLMFERFDFINKNYKIAHILFAEILYREELRTKLANILVPDLTENFYYILDYFKKEKKIKDIPNDLIIKTIISNMCGYIVFEYIFKPGKQHYDKEELKYIEDLIVNAFTL